MSKITCTLLILLVSVVLSVVGTHASMSVGELVPSPTPTPTETPTPTPPPTPSPTPKIVPGSPLSLGGSTFAELISQFDITNLAKLVLTALGSMWVIIILFYVDKEFNKKENKKSKM